jgi:hypothetical protein
MYCMKFWTCAGRQLKSAIGSLVVCGGVGFRAAVCTEVGAWRIEMAPRGGSDQTQRVLDDVSMGHTTVTSIAFYTNALCRVPTWYIRQHGIFCSLVTTNCRLTSKMHDRAVKSIAVNRDVAYYFVIVLLLTGGVPQYPLFCLLRCGLSLSGLALSQSFS